MYIYTLLSIHRACIGTDHYRNRGTGPGKRWTVKTRLTVFGATALALIAAWTAGSRPAAAGNTEQLEAFLVRAENALEERTFGPAWLARFTTVHRAAPPGLKTDCGVLAARYRRVMRDRPVAALASCAEHVLDPETFSAWRAEQDAAREQAVNDWKRRCAETKAPETRRRLMTERPAGLQAAFPPLDVWKITGDSAPFCLEAARCLNELDRCSTALKAVDTIGRRFEGTARVRAAECAGDMLMDMQRPAKALSMYRLGLKAMKKELGGAYDYAVRKSEADKLLLARFRRKIARAQRLADRDRYGPEWVLYRDAERARLRDRAYLKAYLDYEHLCTTYPETIFAAAAAYGKIACLLALTRPEHVVRARRTVRGLAERLAEEKTALARMNRSGAPAADRDAQQENMQDTVKRLQRVQRVPTGDRAFRAAREATDDFLRERYGCYRGAVILAMADHYLDVRLAPPVAEKWYADAIDWFEKVKEIEKQADALAIPDKSRRVSAPPDAMKKTDAWGNIRWSERRPGDLFNRRTADWYVPYHRMIAGMKYAFCLFLRGETERAVRELRIIIAVDKHAVALARKGWPNNYYRLRDDFRNGRLFATREDLRHFSGTVKTQLLVADFYYEIEQWDKAARLHRQFNRMHGDRLDRVGTAYLNLVLGYAAQHDGNKKKSLEYFNRIIREYRDTPSWPRAMFHMFVHYQNDKETHDKALACLNAIRTYRPGTKHASEAHIYTGIFYYSFGKFDKARTVFNECLQRYPGTPNERCATQYLALIEKKSGHQKGEREQ